MVAVILEFADFFSLSKGPLPLVLETQTGLSLTKVNKVFTTSNTQVVNFEVRCSLTRSAPRSGAATLCKRAALVSSCAAKSR